MHNMIPQVGTINWDFTINKKRKPVLVEADITGRSVWLFQMTHGCGAFGVETAEVLRFAVKKMSQKERKQHLFGD